MNLHYPYAATGDLVRYDNANRALNSWGDLWSHAFAAPQGWICPRCGRVWAPSMICCTCKPASTTTGVSTQGMLEEMANDPAVQSEMKAIAEEFAVTDTDGLEE